jgi:hypothetical protein
MSEPFEYRYVIDVFTPDTLPMGRLAEYMGELAQLLGEREHVHFERLELGSAVLVSRVDVIAVPKVATRMQELRDGSAADEVFKAFKRLDSMLESDNAVAQLIDASGAEIIAFPGRTRPKPVTFGPFDQEDSLDGVLVRIGVSGKMASAQLSDGERSYTCGLSRDLAKQIAAHLFSPIRMHGRGKWLRDGEGAWHLENFKVLSFDVLDDRPLSELVAELQAVAGGGWDDLDDPMGELARLRRNGE